MTDEEQAEIASLESTIEEQEEEIEKLEKEIKQLKIERNNHAKELLELADAINAQDGLVDKYCDMGRRLLAELKEVQDEWKVYRPSWMDAKPKYDGSVEATDALIAEADKIFKDTK